MKVIAILLILVFPLCVSAQEVNQQAVERLTDDLAAFQDEDVNYEDLYENYLQLIANPIDLNTATPEALRLVNILSEQQINNFFIHRKENGALINVYELQTIEGFDLATISKLLPFVTVGDPQAAVNRSIIDRILSEKNNYLIMRYDRTLERPAGYKSTEDNRFQGSQDKLYFRFRTSRANDFSFGVTAEKDAGEEIRWNPKARQFGPDHLSFHAQLLNKRRIKNFIVGDFQAQFGQGLLLGSAFGLGKGGETIVTARRPNVGFLPYTSVNESGFFRGIAATYEISEHFFVSAFYSRIHRDGSLNPDSSATTISSILASGLHRNNAELAKRKNLTETNLGTVLHFRKNQFDAGIIIHTTGFDMPLNRTPNVYNQFSFRGSENANAGFYLNYTFRNFSLFTEAGKSFSEGNAVVAGLLGSLDPKFDVALIYRNYARNFTSFYSNAFSENTSPQNEKGLYWGWKYRINRKYALSGYADLFTFPWLKFRSYTPAPGYEWLLRFSIQPSRKVMIYLQARQESKQRNNSSDPVLYTTSPGTKDNYCIHLDYEIVRNIRCKTRLQFSNYRFNGNTSSGTVLLQDLIANLSPVQLTFRHALFDTDDFDNRQYVYENEVWLAYSLPAYYGLGVRNYILAEYKISKKASVWLRYARTRYKNQNVIGSGLDKIEGNTRNDIKIQILYKL